MKTQENCEGSISSTRRIRKLKTREESFPIPLKYIDVSRTTRTNLDVMQERRIDDYCNIDGSRDLSDSWTGFTQFTQLDEKPPDGQMWSGRRLTKRKVTDRGEEQGNLLGESDGSSSTPLQDSSYDGEARNDFRSISGIRVKLYVPNEESFPIPLKYIDVTRATNTSLDRKIPMIIGTLMEIENCQICGQFSQDSLY